MTESKTNVPEFVVEVECDVGALVSTREQGKKEAPGSRSPSYNDFVVKACAIALTEWPRANGSYRGDKFELYSRINIGVAVAAPDTLVVPTIFDADKKSLSEISQQSSDLAAQVRSRSIKPADLAGGTFTISNLGMYGIRRFSAVINPGQAAILAVGAIASSCVARSGDVLVRPTMHLTLSCDHRILYGADAAGFLSRIRELLEQPLLLV